MNLCSARYFWACSFDFIDVENLGDASRYSLDFPEDSEPWKTDWLLVAIVFLGSGILWAGGAEVWVLLGVTVDSSDEEPESSSIFNGQ